MMVISSNLEWLLIGVLILGVALAAAFAVRSAKANEAHVEGIGGWLVVPILGFIAVIILSGKELLVALIEFEDVKLVLTNTTGEYDDLVLPIVLSFLFGVAVIISALICLYKIFISRGEIKKIAVLHYLMLVCAGFAGLWVDIVISYIIHSVWRDPMIVRDAVKGVVVAAIWIPYFLLSKRVQNTFGKSRKSLNPEVVGGG